MYEVYRKNYVLILKKLSDYILSRILIIVNSIIIIPFFAHIMSANEISVYQIAVETLNLSCTCSFDWISKAALRFYTKYKLERRLDDFFSVLLTVGIIVYLLLFILSLIFNTKFCKMFSMPPDLFFITIFLLIPCGIRQFLYQILRVVNKNNLYNFSIFFYQLSLILLFLTLINFTDKLTAVLIAMTVSMMLIDVFIINQIRLNCKISLSLDKSIIREILQYSLPLVVTNTAIWTILNINKFVFQNHGMFLQTAVAGMSWMLGNSIIKPFLTLFLFSVFPLIISRYELKKDIKPFFTNTIQLYCVLFIPVLSALCFYAKIWVDTFFPESFSSAAVVLPFFVITVFLHEFMKLINIKYHLKNKTYIEMFITLIVCLFSFAADILLIPAFGLAAAGAVMLVSVLILIITSTFINFKSLNYIDLKKVVKTICALIGLGLLSLAIVNSLTYKLCEHLSFIKILLFICVNYSFIWSGRKFILC